MYCQTEFLSERSTVDTNNENVIYYFTNYFQWDKVKNLSLNDCRAQCSNRIYSIKKGFTEFYSYFGKCLSNHFKDFEYLNWVAITVPGHDQMENTPNPMDKFLSQIYLPSNIKHQVGIILRNKPMPLKHGKDYGERTVEKDLESFTGNTRNIIDRNFIIFDDITTSGSSMIAAREFLKRRGANKVVCIALGKTVDNYARLSDLQF